MEKDNIEKYCKNCIFCDILLRDEYPYCDKENNFCDEVKCNGMAIEMSLSEFDELKILLEQYKALSLSKRILNTKQDE